MIKIKKFLDFIKFEHSIFALPFVYAGMILALNTVNNSYPEFFFKFLFITISAVTARSSAMALNRIIDAEIDAINPRTKNRHIPAGKIKIFSAWAFTLISTAVFFFSSYQLNLLCLMLSPVPVIMFIVYPHLKKHTSLSHLFLGACLGIAPLGGFIAVTGTLENIIPPLIISFFVVFWVAGFDIIYALQDIEFDLKQKLHSIPAKFGIQKALKISFLFHSAAVFFLFVFYFSYNLKPVFLSGILIIAAFLLYEHKMMKNFNAEKIQKAFFNVNAIVSILFMVFLILNFYI